MTEQIQKQKPSKKLEQLLADLIPDFGKLETKVNAILEQGRKEGLDDVTIGDLIRSKMQEHYSDRTIRRVLPKAAKHSEFANKADKMSASERKPLEVPADKVKVEPTNKSLPSPEVRTVEGIENDGDAIPSVTDGKHREQTDDASDSQQLHSLTIESKPQIQQPGPKVVQGRFNVTPEEYKLEELEEYGKDLLIRIVRFLHDDNAAFITLSETDKENVRLKKENAALKKQVEESKPFIELPPEDKEFYSKFFKGLLGQHSKN